MKERTDEEEKTENAVDPMKLYEKLMAQEDKVRALKTAKADKVSIASISCKVDFVFGIKGRVSRP